MSFDIFEEMKKSKTEQIIFNYNEDSGMKAIIVINNTTLGPAMGGCRMIPYNSTEDAIKDAIKLAVGMTNKISISGGNYGGGKTVVIGDAKTDKNEMLLRDIGMCVQSLNGRYYMGTDVGTNEQDMVYAAEECDFIVGLPEEYGGFGDSSKPTAYGVYMAMKASAKFRYDDESLAGKKVSIQGVGAVGSSLVDYLIQDGAIVTISDLNQGNLDKIIEKYPDVNTVDPEKIYEVDCDIFTPCALGGILNDETIPKLKCDIVAGSANNQLEEPRHGKMLHEAGILFAPDFVINSGGYISAADTVDAGNVNANRVFSKTGRIYDILLEIYKESKEKNIDTTTISNKLANKRIEDIGKIKKRYI